MAITTGCLVTLGYRPLYCGDKRVKRHSVLYSKTKYDILLQVLVLLYYIKVKYMKGEVFKR